jgi:hypothetical protein
MLDLLEQSMQIGDDPALHQSAVLDSIYGDALEHDRPSGRSDTTEVALVRSKQPPPHHDLVVFRNEIVNFISRVRYG